MTLTFFFSMFCSLSGISLSWKTLVFGRFTLQERTNVHRTAFFLHTPDFSLSRVTALKVVWGKDTSRCIKEQGSDLPSCFSTWAPFWKCGWGHHISRSGWGPDWPRFVRIKEHVASKCKQLFEKGTNVFFSTLIYFIHLCGIASHGLEIVYLQPILYSPQDFSSSPFVQSL